MVRPPPYDANFRVTRRMRYVANATSSIQPVTAAVLLESMGAICTATNSTAVPVWGFIRIVRVEIWGTTPAAGATSTVAITWGYQNSMNAPAFGTNREVQDVSTSSAYCPHVVARPPADCNAHFWQARLDGTGARRTGGANVLFSILPTSGAVVDVVCELVAYDAGKSIATTAFTIGTGTAGAYAYAPLDGIGGYFVPSGVDTFT